MIANVPTGSAVVPIITAARIVMNVHLGKTALAMIVTGMTATTIGRIVLHTGATAQGHHPPAAPNMTIVAPGLRPLGGRMIEGLQGTIMTVMIGGEVIMTERLIMIMTDAGTIMTDPRVLGTTEDATRRMGVPSTSRGLPGTGMAVGRAEIAHGFRDVGPNRKWTTSIIGCFLPECLGLHEKLALTYLRAECTFLHGLSRWSLPRIL